MSTRLKLHNLYLNNYFSLVMIIAINAPFQKAFPVQGLTILNSMQVQLFSSVLISCLGEKLVLGSFSLLLVVWLFNYCFSFRLKPRDVIIIIVLFEKTTFIPSFTFRCDLAAAKQGTDVNKCILLNFFEIFVDSTYETELHERNFQKNI